jgi:hypothetical protein
MFLATSAAGVVPNSWLWFSHGVAAQVEFEKRKL